MYLIYLFFQTNKHVHNNEQWMHMADIKLTNEEL